MRSLALRVCLLLSAVGVAACGATPSMDGGVDAGEPEFFDGGGYDAGWHVVVPLPAAQQECGVVALDELVYVVGGFTTGPQAIPLVHRYDTRRRSWSSVAPLPLSFHHPNVAAVRGKLYLVGALLGGGFNARADVLEFDPLTNEWTRKTSLPSAFARGASAVGVIGEKIYVAGGYRGGGAVTDFSVYDPATDTHQSLPPLPVATEHVVGGAVNGRLYVIGGRDGDIASITARVDVYDVASGQWARGPDLPTARGGHAAAVVGTVIIVIGGEGNSRVPSGVFGETELLDTTTMQWTRGPRMLTPRHGTGAASVGPLVLVPGGAANEGFGPSRQVEVFVF